MNDNAQNSNNNSFSISDFIAECKTHDSHNILTFEDRITDAEENIRESLKDSAAIKDAYGNSLLSIGNDDKVEKFSEYTFSNDTLNWPLWLALYNESWVFRRAIDKPAQDEIRSGIEIIGIDDRKVDIQRKLKLYQDDLIQLLQWGALFGGSVAIMMFDTIKGNEDNSKNEYYNSFDKVKVSKAKTMKLYVTDRWYGIAPSYDNTVTNMDSADYGKPKYYKITMSDGKTYTFHHDYVIRYEHRFAPKLIKQGMLQGWGYAEGSHILNELSRDEKLKSSIQSLVNKSLIEVIKMDGMRGVFMGTDAGAQQQLQKRLEMVNWGRSYNSLTFLDTSDDYSMNNFQGLSGLSDLLQQNMWQIAAALEMQGILFGDMKEGFSTDSDALERYSETILGRCNSFVRPVYEKLLKSIYTMLNIDKKVNFEFIPLLNDKHNQDKITNTSNFVQLCSTLMNDGVIDLTQYAEALKTYLLNGTIDFKLNKDNIAKLKEKEVEESESFDLDNDGGM